MARKVFVTSDMAVDERLAAVAEQHDLAALMWPWFLAGLDDWGRARVEPRRLKAQLWPSVAAVTPDVIRLALELWHVHGLVELYEVDGRWYATVDPDKWRRYQTHIRWDRKGQDSASQFPEFPGKCPAGAGSPPRNPPIGWRQVSLTAFTPGTNQETPGYSTPSPSPSPSRETSLRSVSRAPNPKARSNGQISPDVWTTLVALFGEPAPSRTKLYARVGHYLDRQLADHPDPAREIRDRAAAIVRTWQGTSKLTLTSLEAHWSRFDGEAGRITDDEAMRALEESDFQRQLDRYRNDDPEALT